MDEVDHVVIRIGADVQLCAQVFGFETDPALLLIGGATWSMDWWDDELCRRTAARGRRVVRYDQRDTGQSTHDPQGSPGYTSQDLVTDAVAVLDGIGIDRAHIVGLSMGGMIAQRLATDHPHRVATVTLMSTTPIDPTIQTLPGPSREIRATFSSDAPEPDWDDREAVVSYIVEGERPFAGPGNFDEAHVQAIAGRVFDRSNNMAASMTNHFILDEGEVEGQGQSRLVRVPTLVIHGTCDPMFPLEHGRALEESIPGARLIELDGVGHQLPPPGYWDDVIDALISHTGHV